MVEYKDLPVKKYYTSVTVAISCNFDIYKGKSYKNIQNQLFDYALEELNKQIIAYEACAKYDKCFRVIKEMLFSYDSYEFSKSRGKKKQENIFMLHTDVPFKKESLKQENIYESLRIYNIYNKKSNPWIHPETYILKAMRKFRE